MTIERLKSWKQQRDDAARADIKIVLLPVGATRMENKEEPRCKVCKRLDASSDRALARSDWLKAGNRMFEQAEHVEADHKKGDPEARDCRIAGLIFRGLHQLLIAGEPTAALVEFNPALKLAKESTDPEDQQHLPLIVALIQAAQGLDLVKRDRSQGIAQLQAAWRVFAEWPRTDPDVTGLLDFFAAQLQLAITEATGVALLADGDVVDARPYLEQAAAAYEKQAKSLSGPQRVILKAYSKTLRLLPSLRQSITLTNDWHLEKADSQWKEINTSLQKARRGTERLRSKTPDAWERIANEVKAAAALAGGMGILNSALLHLTSGNTKVAKGLLEFSIDKLRECRDQNAKIKGVPISNLYDLDAVQERLENLHRCIRVKSSGKEGTG